MVKLFKQLIGKLASELLIKIFHKLPVDKPIVEDRTSSLFPHKKQSGSKGKIWPYFLISLFSLLIFRGLRLFFFSPFLALIQVRLPLLSCLWISALTGIGLDLLGASLPFGVYALSFTLASLVLFRLRRYFVDKPIGLVSCTVLFSFLTTCGLNIALTLLDKPLPWKGIGILTDFFVLPLFDGLYAWICFSMPMQLIDFAKKQWFHFLFLKKEHKKEMS